MTYAGFFVHLNSIPPVLRWLQWLCPLKYTLEALSVNEVGSGLMIQDSLAGVPVNISASLIMETVSIFLHGRRRCGIEVVLTSCSASLVVRLREEQLLSRRAGALRVYRRIWVGSDRNCMAQGAGETMIFAIGRGLCCTVIYTVLYSRCVKRCFIR